MLTLLPVTFSLGIINGLIDYKIQVSNHECQTVYSIGTVVINASQDID